MFKTCVIEVFDVCAAGAVKHYFMFSASQFCDFSLRGKEHHRLEKLANTCHCPRIVLKCRKFLFVLLLQRSIFNSIIELVDIISNSSYRSILFSRITPLIIFNSKYLKMFCFSLYILDLLTLAILS